MPANICTICSSPHRAELELRLARNVPLRLLAKQYGLNKDPLYHHRKSHMPARLIAKLKTRSLLPAEELEEQRIEESSGLLGRLVWQRAKLYDLLENCEALDDPRACVLIHKTLLENFALTGKLLGEFVQHSSIVTANLVVTPDYLKLRSGLLQALRRFPEARSAGAQLAKEKQAGAFQPGGDSIQRRFRFAHCIDRQHFRNHQVQIGLDAIKPLFEGDPVDFAH